MSLRLPVCPMTLMLDSEDFLAISISELEVTIAKLQLQINPSSAGLTLVVSEFDLTIDPQGGGGRWTKDFSSLAGNGKGVADQNQFFALVVDIDADLLFHLPHALLKLIRGELLFDQVPQDDALLTVDAKNIFQSAIEPIIGRLPVFNGRMQCGQT